MIQRLLVRALLCAGLAPAASATWSIVVVNARTGEVCVASATCINNFDLQSVIAVLRPGEGAACAQSVVDQTGANRLTLWNEIAAGTDPDQILQILAAQDPQHQRRQYGIATFRGGAATFTGSLAGLARYGVTGRTGDLVYAIQGNLLAGTVVVTNAEAALLASSGDTPTRVMAAMHGARVMGGDGRCSCSQMAPTSCGAPPPGFAISAACAFLACARLGDTTGTCTPGAGCANGSYWLDLRVLGTSSQGPDPVDTLQNAFNFWRATLVGYADHILTEVVPSAPAIPADGLTASVVAVNLRNVNGEPVQPGGVPAQLLVEPLDPATQVAVAGAVTDLGEGRFRFPLTSNGRTGTSRWRIWVDYPGDRRVRLWPDLELRADPVQPLHCGYDAVSATAGAVVPLTLNAGAASAGRAYRILGTSTGTAPGITFQGEHLPLNRDRFLLQTLQHGGGASFPDTVGALDAQGRAQGAFVAAPGYLAPAVGRRIDWAALVGAQPASVTNVAGFDVGP